MVETDAGSGMRWDDLQAFFYQQVTVSGSEHGAFGALGEAGALGCSGGDG